MRVKYFVSVRNTQEFVQIFGCKGVFPFTYLRIPMNMHIISNKDWRLVEKRFQKILSSQKGKLMSIGGRLILLDSVLSSLPMFMMSFFRIPKGVLKKLDYYRSRFFFLQCDEHRKKQTNKMEHFEYTKECWWYGNNQLGDKKCVPLEQMVVQSFKRGWHMTKVNKEKIFRR